MSDNTFATIGLFNKYFVGLITVCVLIGCNLESKYRTDLDKFYTYYYDWDIERLPFLKPYEAVLANNEVGWGMNLQGFDGDTGFFNIKKVNVIQGVILVFSVNTLLHGIDVKQSWHVIIPHKRIEKGFDKYSDYLNYLKKVGFKNEPELYDIETVDQYFKDQKAIDWNEFNQTY